MRVMGLDYGAKTVGVSISDSKGIVATPLETITRKGANKLRSTYARLREIIDEYEVTRIVVGLPKHLSGDIGDMGERAEGFARELQDKTGIETTLYDERMTTRTAMDALDKGGVRDSDKKKYVDKLAATVILQGYLDYMAHSKDTD